MLAAFHHDAILLDLQRTQVCSNSDGRRALQAPGPPHSVPLQGEPQFGPTTHRWLSLQFCLLPPGLAPPFCPQRRPEGSFLVQGLSFCI